MHQLLLEKSLEIKFMPNASKRDNIHKLHEKPSDLAIKLAQETLSKINSQK
jgi:hypothetical protein